MRKTKLSKKRFYKIIKCGRDDYHRIINKFEYNQDHSIIMLSAKNKLNEGERLVYCKHSDNYQIMSGSYIQYRNGKVLW